MPTTSNPCVMQLSELTEAVGTTLGPTSWHAVDQERIDRFAEATNDHQWIHTDAGRAAQTPFGATVAHGYLTLSLAPALLEELLAVEDTGMVINYGANRVRFPAPLPVDSRVRMSAELSSVERTGDGSTQVVFGLTFEADSSTKPVCVAEIVFRYYPQPAEASAADAEATRAELADTPPNAHDRPATRALDPSRITAAWLRWLGGSYATAADSLELSRRGILRGDPAALLQPIGRHAELAAQFWSEVLDRPESSPIARRGSPR